MSKIKFLVVYHKKAPLIKNDDFLPIHAGRVLNDKDEWLVNNTLSDASGDNISDKNLVYNELTAVYWAWKNLDSDYYGLTHYRRQFVFDETTNKKFFAFVDENEFLTKINYSREKVEELLTKYHFFVPKSAIRKSVYEHYKSAHDIKDLDKTVEIINNDYPEYATACKEYLQGQESYFYNMFLFDKITFYRYCNFIFGVLKKLEERFETKRMYVSERLTGIFIKQLLLENKRALFLPIAYLEGKEKLSNVIESVKKELKLRKQQGKKDIRSFLYAFRPLIIKVLPKFLVSAYRNR